MEGSRLLPNDDEQQWLREETAALVKEAGWRHYVSAPLVMPDAEHFPDRWTPDAFGVRRLVRRLLNYAGLGELEVSVELFQGEHDVELDAQGHVAGSHHQGAAAWFAGIEDGVCFFGAEVGQLDDPHAVTAAMAHEVAHVFRRVHQLENDDADTEELLTDLTTVYLGFGVLTTNATSRHRSAGGFAIHRWSHSSLGYLPPQAMSYLLALWATVRGAHERTIRTALQSNQAGYFRAASKRLAAEFGRGIPTFELPPREQWPAPKCLAQLALPIHDDNEAEEARARGEFAAQPVTKMNTGNPVFRVRRTQRLPHAFLGGAAGLVLALVAIRLASVGGSLGLSLACCAAGLGALGGAVRGGTKRADRCSDPDCKHGLSVDARRCPGCDGEVEGEIAHEKDRLGAEEALSVTRITGAVLPSSMKP